MRQHQASQKPLKHSDDHSTEGTDGDLSGGRFLGADEGSSAHSDEHGIIFNVANRKRSVPTPQPTKSVVRERPRRWDVTPQQREKRKALELLVDEENVLKDANETDTINCAVSLYEPPSISQVGKDDYEILPEPPIDGLLSFTRQDLVRFGNLVELKQKPTRQLTKEDQTQIAVLTILLKLKNGPPSMRKKQMRQVAKYGNQRGSEIMLDKTLSILNDPQTDEIQSHTMLQVVRRILFTRGAEVRLFARKIVQAVGPMLADDDFVLRMEAREVLTELTQATGMPALISALRPNLENTDDHIRDITARVFAVIANTVGLVKFLPFLKAVIQSRSWTARNTGIRIVQRLAAILGGGNGSAILPYIDSLVAVIKPALADENRQVSVSAAMATTSMAEGVKPYAFDAFEPALQPLWEGLRKHRGRSLAAFIRALASVVVLACHDSQNQEYANYYTRELLKVVSHEFSSADDEMRRTVLDVLIHLPLSKELVGPKYFQQLILPFTKRFWTRRIASERGYFIKMVTDATSTLAYRFGFAEVLDLILPHAKDANELMRRLSMEAIEKMASNHPEELVLLGSRLEYRLIDGVVYAFQEQKDPQQVYLRAFTSVAVALGKRLEPHIEQIVSTILYNLQHKNPEVRQQAGAIVARIAPVIASCYSSPTMMYRLVLILYESLGEVYPEVLSHILDGLYACLDALGDDIGGLTNPTINAILPTLTPILKNRHEEVQESCLKLVGLISRTQSETIETKEWMRICFELLETLKATKKRIRFAANDAFGAIARTIGPSDVIVMLLNNLRMQERKLRVCTAVAIGIVAENCEPFTVLPAIMNEYRIPDKNVQNGVLKALSFMVEYLPGTITRAYLFSLVPLIEDALTDRDQVHRQTAASVVRHIALNCVGIADSSLHEIFVHYVNLLMPNMFETSPHVIIRILEAMDALRIVLGNGLFFNYIWSGLYHPARKVRQPYWKIFDMAYIQNSDALVPTYPGREVGSITEMEVFI
ncbi:U2 snRNP component Hsh155p [Diutina catenulata]